MQLHDAFNKLNEIYIDEEFINNRTFSRANSTGFGVDFDNDYIAIYRPDLKEMPKQISYAIRGTDKLNSIDKLLLILKTGEIKASFIDYSRKKQDQNMTVHSPYYVSTSDRLYNYMAITPLYDTGVILNGTEIANKYDVFPFDWNVLGHSNKVMNSNITSYNVRYLNKYVKIKKIISNSKNQSGVEYIFDPFSDDPSDFKYVLGAAKPGANSDNIDSFAVFDRQNTPMYIQRSINLAIASENLYSKLVNKFNNYNSQTTKLTPANIKKYGVNIMKNIDYHKYNLQGIFTHNKGDIYSYLDSTGNNEGLRTTQTMPNVLKNILGVPEEDSYICIESHIYSAQHGGPSISSNLLDVADGSRNEVQSIASTRNEYELRVIPKSSVLDVSGMITGILLLKYIDNINTKDFLDLIDSKDITEYDDTDSIYRDIVEENPAYKNNSAEAMKSLIELYKYLKFEDPTLGLDSIEIVTSSANAVRYRK